MRMLFKMNTFQKNDSGASAVEFAIVFPLLVVLITGIIQVSSALYTETVMKHAIQDIGRRAMVSTTLTATDMKAEILKKVTGRGLTADNINVTEVSNGDGSASVTFELTYDYEMKIPLVFTKTLALKTRSELLRRE